MMKFLVKQQKIEALEREVIASDQIAFVLVKFVFDGAWKTLHKVVQFTQCEETYNLVLGTEGTTCLLPAELHPGAVKMSLFGYDEESDTTLRATTVPVTLHIRPSGFVEDGTTSIPPTPIQSMPIAPPCGVWLSPPMLTFPGIPNLATWTAWQIPFPGLETWTPNRFAADCK